MRQTGMSLYVSGKGDIYFKTQQNHAMINRESKSVAFIWQYVRHSTKDILRAVLLSFLLIVIAACDKMFHNLNVC